MAVRRLGTILAVFILLGFCLPGMKAQKSTNYNFVAFNSCGQNQPPDAVLAAIDRAMGKS
jgi:hypothetical protein